jgi:uncharacterized membrane protein
MKFWISMVIIAILAGFVSFQVVLRQIPVLKMSVAEKRIAKIAGGHNIMYHAKRPDAEYRGVVRPSPDQLYSACIYDLSRGPVLFEGRAPNDSYWSLSFFEHNTDNFFVINDREIGDREFRFLLVKKGASIPDGFSEAELVRSPSKTGIVLQRIFIDQEQRAQDLDTERRDSICRTL